VLETTTEGAGGDLRLEVSMEATARGEFDDGVYRRKLADAVKRTEEDLEVEASSRRLLSADRGEPQGSSSATYEER
jgi:hypothetical protein